ncbi:Nucleoporin NUP145N [Echria macrotheca]|uniref:Nucleoporin NUP145N n=1 Tax=Echria macrotheca TaxID=438768 RepID=A0AAJ0BKL0_9PEZI|nr:Nucleoporin NUP145N [Echria macrotheca]
MSFGSGFGGGFGQNNAQQSTGFGGFGSNTTSTPAFGSTGTSAFGAQNNTTNTTTGGLFGGGGTGTSSFGTGGFGAGSAFGSKPAFGTTATTTSGGGLFGASTTTAGAPGFGSTSNAFGSTAASSSTPFGGGGGLFGGANKAATTGFGSTSTATPFGGGTTGGSIFGSGGTTSTGFGATNNPGIGTNVGDPPGTAVVAFTPTTEKEANNPSQTNSFQNILFQDPYKRWSADELRLADYNQGRKQGSAGGTGTFGGSGFGTGGFGAGTQTATGFGTTTGGMFGGAQPASTGFGASTTTNTGGFGTGGGLFGANKPATGGGLFGGGTTTQPAQTGGLFGGGTTGGFGTTGNNTTTGGFGTGGTTTGGGLFGNTANAAKPSGFSFGNTGGTGFGATGTTQTGFGTQAAASNTGTGGLFGNTAQNNTTGGGLFGGGQQQTQTGGGFGTGFAAQAQNTAGGLFGNQPKPGGLFGGATTNTTTPAGGGLFGNTAASSTTPFGGSTTTQQTGGGLFGAAKPAATGGLFGSTTTNQAGNTGGGLFGGLGSSAQAQQQPAQNSLFGGNQANQQKPSLFGSQPATGGGLFGNQPAQQQGGLFGSTNNQQSQGAFGNSLLGGSQNTQSQPQPQGFSTSIADLSAYGSTTLFTNLPDDQIKNPGPLATPLSATAKAKTRSILPMYKLSPAHAGRFATPQKRGYGLSYSAYGSPASPSSVSSTPGGLGQSLLANSIGRGGLSRSISTSNLRRSFNVEDSILTPGAFSASTSARLTGGSGSHKRLIINREIRSDLFTPPTKETSTPDASAGSRKLSKRVSFDTSTNENGTATAKAAKVIAENPAESSADTGYVKPTSRTNGNSVNGSRQSSLAAADEGKGKELAAVPEDGSPLSVRDGNPADTRPVIRPPGDYWTSPPLDELRAMNRNQLKQVQDFTVGREEVGEITFLVPVDLTTTNLDDICGGLVILAKRTATVYPDNASKPPRGKGLNVPARIELKNSYPRHPGPGKVQAYIKRLKAQADTTFLSYDEVNGVWAFTVEHFTTYGIEEDEDEQTEADVTMGPPNSNTAAANEVSSDVKAITSPETDPDDTFDFKRSRRAVPGAFDEGALSDDETDEERPAAVDTARFRRGGEIESQEWSEDESMAGAQDDYQYDASQQFSPPSPVDEEQDELVATRFAENDVQVPAGIMRARMRALKKSTAPTKIEVAGGDDWTQILQASVKAPRTMDRATLRALNESGAAWEMKDRGSPAPQKPQVSEGPGFATSIDLMKSLFEQAKGPTQPVQASPAKGFVKWPYQQRPKVDADEPVSVARPNWGPNAVLVTAHDNETSMQPVDSTETPTLSANDIAQLQQYIDRTLLNKSLEGSYGPTISQLAQGDPIWEVASLLFDEDGVNFPSFWKGLLADVTTEGLATANTAEEKAIVCLAGNRVADACGHLLGIGDFRLATLVSCIGVPNQDIRAQLKDWRESNVLAEISEPTRAIYELLAGNAGVCAGVKNVPLEHRVNSFTISQRFGLDWMQAFALRLYYTTSKTAGSGADVAEAVRSFQADIEQDKEEEPDSALWTLLKAFAFRQYDWADSRLGWLLTKAIYSTGKVSFGPDAAEKLDRASISFASTLTAQSQWVLASFVLLQLSDVSSREAAIRDHLGRHAHLIGSPKKAGSPFSSLRRYGVPENWVWEAKALDFRSKQDSRQEFLALIWAKNYVEANNAFLNRVGPDLVIEKGFKRLFTYAQLLYKVRHHLQDWDRGAAVYLLYPMARLQTGGKKQEADRFDDLLFNGLVALRGATHGDIRQEAAIADMAEELIRSKGGDARLYQLLPEDVRGRYMRAQALDNIR